MDAHIGGVIILFWYFTYLFISGITLIYGAELIVKICSHVNGFSHGAKLYVKTHSHGAKLYVKNNLHGTNLSVNIKLDT